jgi:hypothetical protein
MIEKVVEAAVDGYVKIHVHPLGYLLSAIEVYLQHYYPLVYLAALTQELQAGNSYKRLALGVATISVALLLYRLLQMCFVIVRFKNRNRDKRDQDANAEKADDGQRQSHDADQSVDAYSSGDSYSDRIEALLSTGLSEAQVAASRAIHGKNVFWTGRRWAYTLLSILGGSSNMLSAVRQILCSV